MPNDDELLDTELEEEETEESYLEDESDDSTDKPEDNTDTDFEDDIEYDENGDVIVPEEAKEEDKAGDTPKEDDLAKRLAESEEKLRKLESQAKDTLKRLGVKETDVTLGLAKLAADTDDQSVEEYLKKRGEEEELEELRRMKKAQAFQQMAARDLAELQAAFPELAEIKDIRDLPNFQRFAQLKDGGCTAVEAYIAANHDKVREQVATAAKSKAIQDNKQHLRSSVPKGSKDTTIRIPRAKMEEWRAIFPHLKDSEIAKLYRETL